MKPFNDVQRFELLGATKLQAAPTPVVKGKQATVPSFLRTRKPATTSPLLRPDKYLANNDILTYRVGADSREVIRNFTRVSPDLSAAVAAYVRTGITSGFTAVANNPDGSINPEATGALAQIISNMDVLNDYTLGYDDSLSIRSLSEIWARELVTQGECCGELVLNKARLPDKIQPVSTMQIRLFPSSDGRKRIPKQFISGEYIDLDIPTFFMVRIDEDLMEPYAVSPIEPAVQGVLFSAEFMNDLRRVVKKAIHPRVNVTIDETKFRAGLPQDVRQDQDKLDAYFDQVLQDLEEKVNTLSPEDCLVLFDTVGVAVTDHGNTNLSQEYTVIQNMADAKLAAGAKVLPSVLGKSGGTSNTASVEAVMWIKYVEGMVWSKLNEMFSKIFTLAVRLLGHDVIVKFRYNPIDLRPDAELESFRAMRQSRLMALWSIGLMTDEEASMELTGHLPPVGFKPMSGTGFMPATSVQPAGDGANGASNSGSALNQKLSGDAPTGVKGKGKTAEIHQLQTF